MDRNLFLGGNLPGRENTNGYEGTERQLVQMYNLKKLYLLKGGSGLGKSTFMNNFADAFKGHTKDFYHCSGDIKSLDGVIMPDLGIGIIDATAPHIVDPAYPGLGIEEILDLSQFIKPEKMHTSRERIDEINTERMGYYRDANKHLTAALASKKPRGAVNTNLTEMAFQQIRSSLLDQGIKKENLSVKTFARAVTAQGITDYKSSWSPKQIQLSFREEDTNAILQRLHAEFGGYAFLNYMEPDMLEGLFVGGHVFSQSPQMEKSMNSVAMKNAVAALGRADEMQQGKMEAEYAGTVDFSKVNALLAKIIERHATDRQRLSTVNGIDRNKQLRASTADQTNT